MNKQVEELVEWVARQILEYEGGDDWKPFGTTGNVDSGRKLERRYLGLVRSILSHPDLALIDGRCSTTLKWTRVKAEVDMSCDDWDCTRGIKAGESYYLEEHEDGQCESFCLECASFFMSQKLSYVIPLVEALKEVKDES